MLVQVVAVVTPNGIEGNFTPEPRRPLIVDLPFSSTNVKFTETFTYDPSVPPEPQPYETGSSYFKVEQEQQPQSTTSTAQGEET